MVSLHLRRETGASAGISDPQEMFLSRATYLLVLERLPLLELRIRLDDLVRLEDPEAVDNNGGGDGNHQLT